MWERPIALTRKRASRRRTANPANQLVDRQELEPWTLGLKERAGELT
jgi:hypothetical protein